MAKNYTVNKDSLQTELNTVLTSIESKIDPAAAQQIKQAMDRLLEQDNKFNREILVTAVDQLLIIGDAKELPKDEMMKVLTFLEALKDFLGVGLKKLYEYDNLLKEEQRKVKTKIADIQESHRQRFGR